MKHRCSSCRKALFVLCMGSCCQSAESDVRQHLYPHSNNNNFADDKDWLLNEIPDERNITITISVVGINADTLQHDNDHTHQVNEDSSSLKSIHELKSYHNNINISLSITYISFQPGFEIADYMEVISRECCNSRAIIFTFTTDAEPTVTEQIRPLFEAVTSCNGVR